jgi:hypothetical protein
VNEVDAQQWQFAVPTAAPVAVGEPFAQEVRVPLVAVATSQANTPEEPHATSIAFVGAMSGQATDAAVLSAELVDVADGGIPVVGESVSFTFQGRTLAAITGEDGVARVTVGRVDGPVGTTEAGATFAGTDELEPSATTAPFEVRAEDATLVVTVPAKRLLAARLTETDTAGPLGGRTIRFLVDGAPVGTATTDEDGRATLVLVGKPVTDRSVVEAQFDGDGTYWAVRGRR